MKELSTLVEVISRNKVKQIDIIGYSNGAPNQAQQLYEEIHAGNIKSEEDIIQHFFSGNKNAPFYCSRLKRQLKDRLINTVFFLDLNQSTLNDFTRAYYTCFKMAAAAKILFGRNARDAAAEVAEKALEIALQYDITDVAFTMSRDLRGHFATNLGNREKFEKLDQILEEQTNILLAEQKAEKYFSDLKVNFISTRSAQPEYIERAARYAQELRVLSETINSYRFNYMSFLTQVTYYEITNDYRGMLPVCKKALSYFDKKQHLVPINVLFSFTSRILICHTQLKNYAEAKKVVPMCFQYTREGTHNWFIIYDYYMILCFHAGDFQEAYEVSQNVLNHPKLKNQEEYVFEHWIIHEAYIYYLISIGKIKSDANNPVKKFRISKFVNEVPLFSKDKRGINISIIIIQILFLLHQQEYGKIIDRMESLKTYNQRYLRRDDTFRSNCFIRMLLTLPECSFHKTAVLRKAQKYWEKLQEVPLDVAKQSAEIEIIPYETLWGFVLEALDEKWH